MELGIIKNDVLNALKTDRYYNEQEISRLVQSDMICDHQTRVLQIKTLVCENVILHEAEKLLEIYFPNKEVPTEPVN